MVTALLGIMLSDYVVVVWRFFMPNKSPKPVQKEQVQDEQKLIREELYALRAELERANHKLSLSQERLEHSRYFEMYNSLPVSHLVLNDIGLILEANQTASKMFGASHGCLVNQSIISFISSEFKGIFELKLKQCIDSGIPDSWEMRILQQDCSFFWVLVQLAYSQGGELWITLEDITERKSAENDLQFTKEEWERTFSLVPDLITILDNQHRIIYVNKAMADKMNLDPDDCVGQACFKAVHGTDSPPDFCPHSMTIADNSQHEVEVYAESLGGDLLVTSTPFFDMDQNLAGSVHIARDISKLKQTENMLWENKKLMQFFLEHAPAALAMFDRNMCYLCYSDRWLSDYGLGERNLVGLSHYEVSPEISNDWKELHQRALSGEVLREEADRFEREDGSEMWLRWEVRPWYDGSGLVGGIVVFSGDICKQKIAEVSLAKSEELFRSVFYNVATGIAITSRTGQFVHCNASYCSLLGYSLEELAALDFPSLIHPDDHDYNIGFIHQLLAEEIPSFEIENRYIHKNGNVVFVHKYVSVLRDELGQLSNIIALVTDITERRQNEDVLRFLGMCGTTDSKEDFFHALAQYLATALEMDFICIDRLEKGRLSARTLAMFHNGQFEDNAEYALKDTPCGDVVGKKICCFPKNVCALFPDDEVLQDLKAESYLGTTLWGTNGEPIGLIAVISRKPLTDTRMAESVLQMVAVRAAAELEHLLSDEKLQQQEELLRFHLENSPMGVVEWDSDFNVIRWTGEAEQIFGWSEAEAVGRPIGDLNIIYEDDIQIVNKTIAKLTDGISKHVVTTNVIFHEHSATCFSRPFHQARRSELCCQPIT
jgi:PAS domain S-box-containing protein